MLVAIGPRFHELPSSVDASDLRVTRWAVENLDASEIDVGAPGTAGYLLWVAILQRGFPGDTHAIAYHQAGFDPVPRWIEGDDEYFLASSPAQLAEISAAGVPIQVVRQDGNATLVRRQ